MLKFLFLIFGVNTINEKSLGKNIDFKEKKSNFIFNFSTDWYFFNKRSNNHHRWHLVSPSPWPVLSACSALILVIGFIGWMHNLSTTIMFLFNTLEFGFTLILLVMFLWFRDIHRENLFGFHTTQVEAGLRTGFVLFILSEVMFFFSFFWTYFHVSLDPSVWTGNIWPPEGIVYFHLSENIWLAEPETGIIASTFYENDFLVEENNLYYLPKPAQIYSDLCAVSAIDWYILYLLERDWLLESVELANWTFLMNELFDEITNIANREVTMRNYERAEALIESFDIENMELFYVLKVDKIYTGNLAPQTFLWFGDNIKPCGARNIFVNLHDKGSLTDPFKIPLLNTAILLTSGAVLTVAHYALRLEKFFYSMFALFFTVFLALFFIASQLIEFVYSPFSIDDGIYGSIFFLLTGFHGFHVIIGTIFLSVCFFRMHLSHFTRSNHFGFEAAIWYWHFVDVVRIFLYIFLYLWPNWYFFGEYFWVESGLENHSYIYSIHLPLDSLLTADKSDINQIVFDNAVKNKYIMAVSTNKLAIEKMDIIDYNFMSTGYSNYSENNNNKLIIWTSLIKIYIGFSEELEIFNKSSKSKNSFFYKVSI